MSATRISDETIQAFKEIDAACVGDVVRALGLNGIAEGLQPLARNMKVCGPAVTLRHIAARDNLNRARHEQALVEFCQAGDVLVIDMGGRVDGGTWGGNITIDAQRRGLNGVVIDGGTRDVEDIVEAGFPTFSRGVTLRHTHGTFMTTCLNTEPVQIGTPPFTVPVAPGDLVIGNADGIVIVPSERADEILALAQRRHELDEDLARELRAGKGHGTPEVDGIVAAVRGSEGVEQADDYRW